MRTLGILSVQKEKAGRLPWPAVKIKERFLDGISVVVAEFSASAAKIQTMPGWRKKWLQRKGQKCLKSCGAEAVVMTLSCAEAFGKTEESLSTVAIGIPEAFMQEAVCAAMKYLEGTPLGQTAWFLDRDCQKTEVALLGAVSRRVQYLGIITKEREHAEVLAEQLCEEYGVNLEMQAPGFILPGRTALAVDMDLGQVQVGREFIINGMEVSLQLGGYDVNPKPLIEEFPELSQKLSFKAWLSGKNRLTR